MCLARHPDVVEVVKLSVCLGQKLNVGITIWYGFVWSFGANIPLIVQ